MKAVLDRPGWLLIGAGIALLVVGGWLAYPYVHSRVAAPKRPPATSVILAQPTALPRTEDPPPTEKPSRTPTTTARPRAPEASATATATTVGLELPTATAEPSKPPPTPHAVAPPTRIVLPRLGVDAPVVPVSWRETEIGGEAQAVWDVPDLRAAGWHRTSARLGESGNTVLNGHNTNNGEIFRDLYRLDPGDEIILYAQAISYTFHVSQTLILPESGQPLQVRLDNARYVMPTDDERLTLVTCHPYGSLRNRLIVIARREG